MTTSSITRPTETICPPWCNGHLGGYQDWEQLVHQDGQIREHCGVEISTGAAHVYVNQTELEDHTLRPARIDLYVDNDTAELTPGEARALARALLMFADEAEARQ